MYQEEEDEQSRSIQAHLAHNEDDIHQQTRYDSYMGQGAYMNTGSWR